MARTPKQPTPDPDADAPEGAEVDPLGSIPPVGADEGDEWHPSDEGEAAEHDADEQAG